MAVIVLLASSLCEVIVMASLEKANNFKNIIPTISAIVFQILSVYLLSISTTYLPLSLAYASWTGLGIVGTCLYGIIFLKESKSFKKYLFILIIMCGLIGLKVFS